MKTRFNSRNEYIDYLSATLGEGYDLQSIADETSGWDMNSIKVVNGRRRATAYVVTADDGEMAEIVRHYSHDANELNFFVATTANFTKCGRPEGEPDHVSGSGSAYWYVNGGVVRESDHWGAGVASCDWYIDGSAYGYGMHPHGTYEYDRLCGFCAWDDFERM